MVSEIWQKRVWSCATCNIPWKKNLEVIPDIVDVSLGVPVVVGAGEIPHHRYEVVGYGGYLFGCVGDVCGIGKVNT